MYKNLMDVLVALAKEIVENDMKIEEAIIGLDDTSLDLFKLKDELRAIERTGAISDEELDAIRSMISYIFMKNSDIEPDVIYAMVFGSGKYIIWN
ncbi:MAG: hypothetical protein JSV21_11880 [Nitrospirota bacterium]|nr:MAG: hypothetical protein JSV21_11880 [Nitrospirota bacterium]